MTKLNMKNRTLAVMDNLPFLRSLNNECIDLIAIDPPFAANETFTGRPKPPITDAEIAEEKDLAKKHGAKHDEGRETTVQDIWTWDANTHPDWLSRMEDDYPPVFSVIKAVEASASENEAAYIAFMAVRLIECRRVLRATGSIYMHCDTHANSYLRMLMDAVFGVGNFRNEIVWAYRGGGVPKSDFARKHDTILRYSKAQTVTFNVDAVRIPYSQDSKERLQYKARSFRDNKTYDAYEPNPKGKHPEDWWVMQPIMPSSKERTGYATQKPLRLYERIIAASSNPGDVVLDIFAGCATTAVAAERLERQWIACDIAYRSWTMLKRRFALNGFALSDTTSATIDALKGTQPALSKAESNTIGPQELPGRNDEDPVPFYNLPRVRKGKKSARSATWSGRVPKDEAKELLVKEFGPYCWGCGWEAPRFPSGKYDLGLLEVDHIWARRDESSDSGGSDELYNLALLHPTCNRRKGNRLTLEELRQRNADDQRVYGQLVHLGQATQFAAEHILQRGSQLSTEPR